MGRLLLYRLGGMVTTLLLSSMLVFGSLYLAPGSPENVLFGSRAPSAEARAAVRHQLHLDQPLLVRYWDWLTGLLHGDLGRSMVTGQPVSDRVGAGLGTTVLLVGLSIVLVVLLGLTLGTAAALWPGRVDGAVNAITSVSVTVPPFVASTLLISVFAVRLGWFPASGTSSGLSGTLHGLVLPSCALALISAGFLARITRNALREQLDREHVQTALVRGLPRRVVLRDHVFRNALPPVITAVGLLTSGLFASTLVVESAFAVPGIGQLTIQSVAQKDFPVVQAVALLLVGAFVVCNAVSDLVQALIDPRLRTAGRTA
ncbi:ABC transporter permease [Streptomyces sp. NPDC090052]|uniref:ABC transporter permease n=1 Tax=unclassified Streptomyces TaxID=2593676 RepID=UPI0022505272|nr:MULTISPECIES: ABC transporter permease [unclassified Streptomyces]MCX4722341.1 ABC transporter permease [Streptomyces sp. NBC_01306]WSV07996.1 ABC transporter permease [Streptomyces sp. NBC_01020]WSX46084.1 ABC transporter permease [Streptomyces sp. NBC_00963]WSX65845.1 ABC transporter permease [Streptomyces sp. NBC_00932]